VRAAGFADLYFRLNVFRWISAAAAPDIPRWRNA
jgi:hypothetical protein